MFKKIMAAVLSAIMAFTCVPVQAAYAADNTGAPETAYIDEATNTIYCSCYADLKYALESGADNVIILDWIIMEDSLTVKAGTRLHIQAFEGMYYIEESQSYMDTYALIIPQGCTLTLEDGATLEYNGPYSIEGFERIVAEDGATMVDMW